MTAADEVRDPTLPGRLLAVERDALLPLLRSRPDADFALPTPACPGWTVRDVLAHCSAVLVRVVESRFEKGVFSPESNERDIAERAEWTNTRVLDELERGMTEAGEVIAERADGAWDPIAFGEWVHAGDVREGLGEPGAYTGEGRPHALSLLAGITRDRGRPRLQADLDDVDEPLHLGVVSGTRTPARFIGDSATLVRLYTGRAVDGVSYELTGAAVEELNLYG
ncbi:maleylpyruvate isomerase family mycothiol-dependent enzyme [Streptomyces sp. NPDC093084]|uniref:maleylpyruvate isomerase family mycothiol-dependent enzyme n=1 Tax=Streptomyces sp. NPDC093084 TaxID=3155197 RepID=UPI003446E571